MRERIRVPTDGQLQSASLSHLLFKALFARQAHRSTARHARSWNPDLRTTSAESACTQTQPQPRPRVPLTRGHIPLASTSSLGQRVRAVHRHGRELLGHELAPTIQQSDGMRQHATLSRAQLEAALSLRAEPPRSTRTCRRPRSVPPNTRTGANRPRHAGSPAQPISNRRLGGSSRPRARLGLDCEASWACAFDIDEPLAVSGGGAWDDPANKRFLESNTNRLTKNALTESAPPTPQGQLSLAAAEAVGEEAFYAAAGAIFDRNFSDVAELETVTNRARARMRNLNRPVGELKNALNTSIRNGIKAEASPEDRLIAKAMRVRGVDPQELGVRPELPQSRPTGLAGPPPEAVTDTGAQPKPPTVQHEHEDPAAPKAPTTEDEIAETDTRTPREADGPDFVPKAFRFGAEVAEGVIFSLIADYFSGKILQYFKRRALRSSLADLEPEINDYKQVALDSSPPEIRRAIEHPVWPNIRQFYWVITIRLRTTTVVGVRAPTVSSTQPHLVSVAIAEKERSGRSGVHQGKTVVAPAQHPVIMLQDSETVTYSRPIVSWGVVYPPVSTGFRFARSAHALEPQVDPLRFASTGEIVTTDGLYSWAKGKYPRMFADPNLVRHIQSSNEFAGSENARSRALEALMLKLQEEEFWSHF